MLNGGVFYVCSISNYRGKVEKVIYRLRAACDKSTFLMRLITNYDIERFWSNLGFLWANQLHEYT